MKRYRLEMLVAFIVFNIGADLYFEKIRYPVWFYAIILATMLYLANIIYQARKKIKENATPPVQPLESHIEGNDLWTIFISKQGQRLLQLAYKDKKGNEIIVATVITYKRYKALKRGHIDCATCFADPFKGLICYTINGKDKWIRPGDMKRKILPGVNPFVDKKFHRKEEKKLKSIWERFFPALYKKRQEQKARSEK